MAHTMEKSYERNLYVRFDDDEVTSAVTSSRGFLLCQKCLMILTSMFFVGTFAAEVDSDMASLAVRNWMKRSPHPMNARFKSVQLMRTQTVRNKSSVPLFHVVEMEGGGFVVASGDTRIKPVIAFSDTGAFDSDACSPLFTLLYMDMSNRLTNVSSKRPIKAKKFATAESRTSEKLNPYEEAWAELTATTTEESARKNGLYYASEGSLADVRVEPLVQASWGQEDFGGEYTFNYYTPNHYECGCVVTAFAQVMRKWEAPESTVAGMYRCWVDGVAVNTDMKSGAYNWANMPYQEANCTTEAQRQAIGKLTYDLGVASQMHWGKNGSGTLTLIAAEALRTRFGYASCNAYSADMKTNIGASLDYRNAILASLDAGMPTVIGVSNGSMSGHEIVVDGYGFDGDTDIYCHLNCGWRGLQNMWYNLIGESVTEWYGYTCVDDVAYNIHPIEVGEVISGRVLSGAGVPVSGATVTLSDMDGKKLAEKTANAKGIYSFRVAGANRYRIAAKSGGISSKTRTVTLWGRSVNATRFFTDDGSVNSYAGEEHGSVANQWGEDVVLDDGKAVTVTFNANGGDGMMEAQSLVSEAAQKLADCQFERGGYSFDGWATSTGGAVIYTDGQSVTLSSGLTLYAHWTEQPNTVLIRYNANGGTGVMRSDVRSTTSVYGEYLPWNCFIRTGYVFMGWALKPDGEVRFSDHDFVRYDDLTGRYFSDEKENTSGLISLYAIWEKVDSNGFVIQDGVLKKWDGIGTTDIVIPDGIVAIEAYAFQGTSLTSVAFPASLKSIGAYAFDSCTSLTNVRFSIGLKNLGTAVFRGCSSLNGVFELPEGVEMLYQVISGTRITDVVLPTSITKMASQIFFSANVVKVWFKGNAPGYDNGESYAYPEYRREEVSPYYRASAELISYVPTGSTGWKDGSSALPAVWPVYSWAQGDAVKTAEASRPIQNYTGAPPKGTSGVVIVPDKVKVTFNANGGSMSSASLTVEYGAAVGVLPTATRDGYTFNGWFTAAEGGAKVAASTVVTADVIYYAHWTKNKDPIPEPPEPEPPVYHDDNMVNDVSFGKVQTVQGVLYDEEGMLAGVVQLKFGKKNKKGVVKVSASATLLSGKKITAKAVSINTGGVVEANVAFKSPIGSMLFEMDADGYFSLYNDMYDMESGEIGGAIDDGSLTFDVDIEDEPNFGDGWELLYDALPEDVPIKVTNSGNKWSVPKSATIKYKKFKEDGDTWYELDGLDDDSKPNVSGLKLTYTSKTGVFKGSFKLYTTNEDSIPEGKKPTLKKYTVTVTGFVVDGMGYGQATLKKPATTWAVWVE